MLIYFRIYFVRYYIEKLLSMKHEDIQDLSIQSSSSDSRTRSEKESSQSGPGFTRSSPEITKSGIESASYTSSAELNTEVLRNKMISPLQGKTLYLVCMFSSISLNCVSKIFRIKLVKSRKLIRCRRGRVSFLLELTNC